MEELAADDITQMKNKAVDLIEKCRSEYDSSIKEYESVQEKSGEQFY